MLLQENQANIILVIVIDILKDVKGCKETNRRPLQTNNIENYFKIYSYLKNSK